MNELIGGIEAGGTNFVCAIGTGPDDIRARTEFGTTLPDETVGRTIDFFRQQEREHGRLAAIGIASFGPVDPNPDSHSYGYITTTPKPHWGNTDLGGQIGQALGVPVGFDTDVNGAALGEWRWGAARGLQTFIYLTVGTGIGGGGMVNGGLLHGLMHPEMGHIRIPHDREADPYGGHCPYHADCLEGLACGPAIAERWGQPAEQLPADHPAWELQARYLALALINFICVLSPQRIILGGGVMAQPRLFPLIRQNVQAWLNDYIQARPILDEIDDYIVPPALGDDAGVLGAIALGQQALAQKM